MLQAAGCGNFVHSIRWGCPLPGCPVKIMFYLALVTIPVWRDSNYYLRASQVKENDQNFG
jgi:hypothetical protein